MKYYILDFDEHYDCISSESIPREYEGISLNLATAFDRLPAIELTVAQHDLPDCIPNNRRYLYFNSKILDVIRNSGFINFQSFDLNITDTAKRKINSGHKLVNILSVVNAIDRKNSILHLDEDEEDEHLNIVDIRSLKLDYSKAGNETIFRLGGFETLLVFREDIAQAIVNSRCKGLQFSDADGYSV